MSIVCSQQQQQQQQQHNIFDHLDKIRIPLDNSLTTHRINKIISIESAQVSRHFDVCVVTINTVVMGEVFAEITVVLFHGCFS